MRNGYYLSTECYREIDNPRHELGNLFSLQSDGFLHEFWSAQRYFHEQVLRFSQSEKEFQITVIKSVIEDKMFAVYGNNGNVKLGQCLRLISDKYCTR